MSGDDTARLIYLVVLLVGIGGWLLLQGQARMGKVLQQAMIWGFIFVGTVAAIGLWEDVQRSTARNQITQLSADSFAVPRQPDGHYYVTAEVNDAPIRFVVDTGATDMVLTQEDAARAGLDPAELDYLGRANTANGEVRTARVTLDRVRLGSVTDLDVRAVVNSGEMEQSLLGMGYLQRWGEIRIANGELILSR